jgi:hypothetical protein
VTATADHSTLGRDQARESVGRRIVLSLRLVQRFQRPDGEILSYRQDARGNHVYCRTPLPSTFVHDALGCFDPTSAGWSQEFLGIIPARARAGFVRTIVNVRRQIRAFLIWQQEPAGWWRFFGRGSGIDPDVNTTACASFALLESYGARSVARWERQAAVVSSFRSPTGPFHTFQRPSDDGYGWLDDAGRPVAGFDPVVNTAVLDCLCAMNGPQDPAVRWLIDHLMGEVLAGDPRGTPLYPNPLVFLYAVSRAWARHGLPGRESLAEAVLPALLRTQAEAGDFGGPLSTALGASALLDLRYTGERRTLARRAVLRGLHPNGGWPHEDFIVQGFGSRALTTAVSMAFLARDFGLTGDLDE